MTLVYDRVLFLCIGFGCQKVALKFLIGKLHKAVPILFRCPKIRKQKYKKFENQGGKY